jgi:hypothetical protein
MRLIREYDFNGRHYGVVELDDGSRVEIKGADPLARAQEMQTAGVFSPQVEVVVGKRLSDFSDSELLAEVSSRNIRQVVRGVVI